MASRTTIKDCEDTLFNLGKRGGFRVWRSQRNESLPKNGGYFFIEVAYGRPRVIYQYRIGGTADISPRLPTGHLREWLKDFGVAGFRNWLKYKRAEF